MTRDWRQDKPTDRQIEAIKNMRTALGWTMEVPKTKGECSDLITKMKEALSNTQYHNHDHPLQDALDFIFT